MDRVRRILAAAKKLNEQLATLRFGGPVTHVYNPLDYAFASYADYVRKYATTPKRVLFFGMNPGPYGMTQTGVPFGEVGHVRDFLGVHGAVKRPAREHPKRPVLGFACPRSEVSGARFWGLWRAECETPERFFAWAFVSNYCPLVFMEASGRNVTPDKLAPTERAALLPLCDAHTRAVVAALEPAFLVGVGKFAEGRARALFPDGGGPHIATIPHPSPASPGANRDWAGQVLRALDAAGVPRGPARAR